MAVTSYKFPANFVNHCTKRPDTTSDPRHVSPGARLTIFIGSIDFPLASVSGSRMVHTWDQPVAMKQLEQQCGRQQEECCGWIHVQINWTKSWDERMLFDLLARPAPPWKKENNSFGSLIVWSLNLSIRLVGQTHKKHKKTKNEQLFTPTAPFLRANYFDPQNSITIPWSFTCK